MLIVLVRTISVVFSSGCPLAAEANLPACLFLLLLSVRSTEYLREKRHLKRRLRFIFVFFSLPLPVVIFYYLFLSFLSFFPRRLHCAYLQCTILMWKCKYVPAVCFIEWKSTTPTAEKSKGGVV